jgi:hypothetical protein
VIWEAPYNGRSSNLTITCSHVCLMVTGSIVGDVGGAGVLAAAAGGELLSLLGDVGRSLVFKAIEGCRGGVDATVA